VRYVVLIPDVTGPLVIVAELMYQPIGYRWTRNLDGVGVVETDRFVASYDTLASSSGVVLARDSRLQRIRE
jgi:hypothetical protein